MRGVAFVTGNMSPTMVLKRTIANKRFTPEIRISIKRIGEGGLLAQMMVLVVKGYSYLLFRNCSLR